MAQITDFKVGQKAYILYRHLSYNRSPEIFETTVTKVGKRYVTVSDLGKQFKRHGDIEGLLEHSEYGELGVLFTTKENAEIEKKRIILLHNVRTYSNYLDKCTYEQLRTIMDILKVTQDRRCE